MKSLIADPVVLICCGAILVGCVGLIWAIAKFRRLSKPGSSSKSPYDDLLSGAPELRGLDLGQAPARSIPFPVSMPVTASAPAVSKEVAERLDSMTQRLSEMQTLLSKQAASASLDPSAHAGAMGQGFSPETIDKLLKIIGNVVQQVDILQKNLNPSKEGAATKTENPSTPG